MRVPLPRALSGPGQGRDGRTRLRFLVPVIVATLLAGLLATLGPSQPAVAAVTDYRPATYNMQGGAGAGGSKWTTDLPQLMNAGYNVLALQEAGPRPPQTAQLMNTYNDLASTAQWRGWDVEEWQWDPFPRQLNPAWYIYFVRTDFSGPAGPHGGRVNLAIVTSTRASSVLIARPAFYGNNGLPSSRPALGVRLGQTLFYTVHAVSGDANRGGNDGPGLVANIEAQANGRVWAAMGDWNREPARLALPRYRHKYTSGGPTHMGDQADRELDYMVSNQRIAGYEGVARGFGSDHLAVMFRRLAANAGVQLLNVHDGSRAIEVQSQDSGTLGSVISSANTKAGPYGHFKFVAAGNGNYTIRVTKRDSGSPEQCLDAIDTRLRRYSCDGTNSQLFDIQYWDDTGELRLKPLNRSTCIGDDTDFGWGTEIVTTMACSRGEARFNFRFDFDPGPNAPLVVF